MFAGDEGVHANDAVAAATGVGVGVDGVVLACAGAADAGPGVVGTTVRAGRGAAVRGRVAREPQDLESLDA